MVLVAENHTRSWVPPESPWGSILLLHGLAEHSGRYERTGSLLAESGLDVEAMDLSGFGRSPGRRGHVDRLDVWLRELAARLDARPDGVPRVLMGQSMGGLVALAYSLSDFDPPDALVVSAPALDADIAGWKKTLARLLSRVAPTARIPNQIDGALLSSDPTVGEAYLADPLLVPKTTLRLGATLLDAQADVVARCHLLTVPTLVIHGSEDRLVPARASEVLAGGPTVERRLLDGLRHEPFNEPSGPQVVADVTDWIRSTVGQGGG